jgi:hypothetical protein
MKETIEGNWKGEGYGKEQEGDVGRKHENGNNQIVGWVL